MDQTFNELVKSVFSNQAGEKLFIELMKTYVLKRTTTQDPWMSAFQDGQRDVVLAIHDIMQAEEKKNVGKRSR